MQRPNLEKDRQCRNPQGKKQTQRQDIIQQFTPAKLDPAERKSQCRREDDVQRRHAYCNDEAVFAPGREFGELMLNLFANVCKQRMRVSCFCQAVSKKRCLGKRVWVWTAQDAQSKAWLAWHVGGACPGGCPPAHSPGEERVSAGLRARVHQRWPAAILLCAQAHLGSGMSSFPSNMRHEGLSGWRHGSSGCRLGDPASTSG
jgi:hypothetical protein